jgi:uncharacterized tellurite resistance protein B-like protein
MFADLLRRLTAPAPSPLAFEDSRLALAALLVRLARSDGDYAQIEREQIDRVLAHRYKLDTTATATLRQAAETLEAEAPDTVRFTRAIKDCVPYEDRLHVIEALWFIALADGTRDSQEDSLLRMIAPMLGVNDRDSNLARKRVESAHYND